MKAKTLWLLKWTGIWLLAQLVGGIIGCLTRMHDAVLPAAILLGVILAANVRKVQRTPATVLLFSLAVVLSVGLVVLAAVGTMVTCCGGSGPWRRRDQTPPHWRGALPTRSSVGSTPSPRS